MRDYLDRKLCFTYPLIFKNRYKDPKESCMHWGFECDDGWYDLINKLCKHLQWMTDKNGYPQVVAQQVKEKYGTLRFYFGTEDGDVKRCDYESRNYTKWQKVVVKAIKFLFPFLRSKLEYSFERENGYIDGVVSFAESMSGITCECCGKPGKTEGNSLIITLCKSCKRKNDDT